MEASAITVYSLQKDVGHQAVPLMGLFQEEMSAKAQECLW